MTFPQRRSPEVLGGTPGTSTPRRGIFLGGWASVASGAARRLRMSVTMHPMTLYHMVVPSRQPHADLLLSIEAERRASGAGSSRSEE